MDEGVVAIPIDGVLDLHSFLPADAASVVDDYLRACHEKGILEVRVIHGKGKGVLRRTVHALLERHPFVLGFALDSGASGWGATIVHLRKTPPFLKSDGLEKRRHPGEDRGPEDLQPSEENGFRPPPE